MSPRRGRSGWSTVEIAPVDQDAAVLRGTPRSTRNARAPWSRMRPVRRSPRWGRPRCVVKSD